MSGYINAALAGAASVGAATSCASRSVALSCSRVRTVLDGPPASDVLRYDDVPGTAPLEKSGDGAPITWRLGRPGDGVAGDAAHGRVRRSRGRPRRRGLDPRTSPLLSRGWPKRVSQRAGCCGWPLHSSSRSWPPTSRSRRRPRACHRGRRTGAHDAPRPRRLRRWPPPVHRRSDPPRSAVDGSVEPFSEGAGLRHPAAWRRWLRRPRAGVQCSQRLQSVGRDMAPAERVGVWNGVEWWCSALTEEHHAVSASANASPAGALAVVATRTDNESPSSASSVGSSRLEVESVSASARAGRRCSGCGSATRRRLW